MAADSSKYTLVSIDPLKLQNIFPFRTKKTKAFVYLFISVFIFVTFFFAFSPSSNPSSPWFSNIFSTSFEANSTTSITNDGSSHTSSIYSYFFPSDFTKSDTFFMNVGKPDLGVNGPVLVTEYGDLVQNNVTENRVEKSDKSQGFVPTFLGNDTGSWPSQRVEEKSNGTGLGMISGNMTMKHGNDSGSEPGQGIEEKSVKSNVTDLGIDSGNMGMKLGNEGMRQGNDTRSGPSKGVEEKSVKGNVTDLGMKHGNDTRSGPSERIKEKSGNRNVTDVGMKLGNDTRSVPSIKGNVTDLGIKHGNEEMKNGNDTQSVPSQRIEEKRIKSNVTDLGMKQGNEGLKHGNEGDLVKGLVDCDLFDGEWVRDESYPLYKPGSCVLIDEQFNCFANGRRDLEFQKYKWKPKGCALPRLDGSKMLELLRGKRLVFVGDSLNRNMWESLICILRNSIKDKRKVYEVSGRQNFRSEPSYAFVFKDYKCTVEFFVAPFLVQEWEFKEKNGTKKETLRLDLMSSSAHQYKTADVVVFNTGHWWTHDKTSKGEDYYQEGGHVYRELNVLEAFRKAMTTWGMWVDANINPKKTSVFFRGYSASHFSGGQWNSGGACDHETEPINNTAYLTPYPDKMVVLEKVFKGMKSQVSYLNITKLTDFRKDGHPSIYRKQHYTPEEIKSPFHYQDCSHWCLPGVPDAWNEILYAQLLVKHYQSHQQM